MIPWDVVEKAAHAALHADHPEASGWSGKDQEYKDRYRKIARAVLKSAEPDEEIHGYVGVTCQCCDEGGFYPPGGWTPVDEDGNEFVYFNYEWYCGVHAADICYCCGGRGYTVTGHLSDGTAEQHPCECCESAHAAEQAGEVYTCPSRME